MVLIPLPLPFPAGAAPRLCGVPRRAQPERLERGAAQRGRRADPGPQARPGGAPPLAGRQARRRLGGLHAGRGAHAGGRQEGRYRRGQGVRPGRVHREQVVPAAARRRRKGVASMVASIVALAGQLALRADDAPVYSIRCDLCTKSTIDRFKLGHTHRHHWPARSLVSTSAAASRTSSSSSSLAALARACSYCARAAKSSLPSVCTAA